MASRDAPPHPLQQSLKDLERVYANFLPSGRIFPIQEKGRADSFRYPQQIKLDEAANRRIFLGKLSWLHYRNRFTV